MADRSRGVARPELPPQILCKIFYHVLGDGRTMLNVELVCKVWKNCAERVCAVEAQARGWTAEDAKGISWNKCIHYFGYWWKRWSTVYGARWRRLIDCFSPFFVCVCETHTRLQCSTRASSILRSYAHLAPTLR
jgi:hypothetical protein